MSVIINHHETEAQARAVWDARMSKIIGSVGCRDLNGKGVNNNGNAVSLSSVPQVQKPSVSYGSASLDGMNVSDFLAKPSEPSGVVSSAPDGSSGSLADYQSGKASPGKSTEMLAANDGLGVNSQQEGVHRVHS